MTPTVLGTSTGGCAANATFSVGVWGSRAAGVTDTKAEVSDDGVSGKPRSFSPMFGMGRRDGVQYWK